VPSFTYIKPREDKQLKDVRGNRSILEYEPLRNRTHPNSFECFASFQAYWRNNQYIVSPFNIRFPVLSNNNTSKCSHIRAIFPVEFQPPSFTIPSLILYITRFILLPFNPARLETSHLSLQYTVSQSDALVPFNLIAFNPHIFDLSCVCHPRPRRHLPIGCV